MISSVSASHFMGGEITWTCQGAGMYTFELAVYRDCNGSDVNNLTLDLDVWNHPTLTQIDLNFKSREDLSPNCTQVAGGPMELECGVGSLGGNGAGAIERLFFESDPIQLLGVPPTDGWSFTWDDFSRSWDLTNLQSPSAHGLTISATMFPYQGQDVSTCYDQSPQFGQQPYLITCAGETFQYNQNAYDPDLDSLVFEFDKPLNHLAAGTFDPGVNPIYVPFEAGFSHTSPTPGVAMNAGNIPAVIDAGSGAISYTSFNQGNFAINVKISAYRNQIKISETTREIQTVVIVCADNNLNNPPVITPPFAGNTSYEIEVLAGDLVTFDFIASDLEVLQDGSVQNNTLTPSGPMFGANFNDPNTGCDVTPCATLNQPIPFTDAQGVQTTFNWQTSCEHIKNSEGVSLDEVPYHFVFKVADDYCTVPKVSYATVTIRLKNSNVIPATNIQCIDVMENDDAVITWEAIDNSAGTFNELEVHTVQDGLLTTITNPAITSFTHVGSGTTLASKDYFIIIKSGCGGLVETTSEAISSMFVSLNNPNNGTAILQWNEMSPNQQAGWNDFYHIYREYPVGTWTLIDSVAYGTVAFVDTVDICSSFLNYEIRLTNMAGCSSTSNVVGDFLEDGFAPTIPVITSVTVDTLTGGMSINWGASQSDDTYGYIIFQIDAGGFPVVVDTVYGLNTTSYLHNVSTDDSELSYTLSAFDSCFTTSVPPTYQTSAKAEIETSNFLSSEVNICSKELSLSWTGYNTWGQGVDHYEVYYQIDNGPFDFGVTLAPGELSYLDEVLEGKEYCYFIKAIATDGTEAFSNERCHFIDKPTAPNTVYVQTATVESDNSITVLAHIDPTINASHYVLERKDDISDDFQEIETVQIFSDPIEFNDYSVDPESQSYWYQVTAFDSCGHRSTESQLSKTIHLQISSDEISMLNFLSWSLYEGFDGAILGYRIYRGVGGIWETSPIATVGINRYFEDDVSGFVDQPGDFCYRVEAIESTNSFGINETAFSNQACANFTPLIYIPNAFVIGGVNDVFKPIISLHDFNEYNLRVFNRWGEVIHSSSDHRTGWNGVLKNGKTAPEGVYVYVVTLSDTGGREHQKRGHVTLLNAN